MEVTVRASSFYEFKKVFKALISDINFHSILSCVSDQL